MSTCCAQGQSQNAEMIGHNIVYKAAIGCCYRLLMIVSYWSAPQNKECRNDDGDCRGEPCARWCDDNWLGDGVRVIVTLAP
jgi:hypothetical protein